MSDEDLKRADGEEKNGRAGEEEIESKHLQVQAKRFYVDVKQNARGRFVKIAEMGAGHKSRLILSMPAALAFRDHLNDLIEFSKTLPEEGNAKPDNGGSTQLKSETLMFETRRYYMDLRENARGRFLRVAQTVSAPRGRGPNTRSQVAIPASGLTDLRDALTDLLNKHSEGYLTEDNRGDTPDSKTLRAALNKTFYFDVGRNDNGTFVRISEVKQNSGFRTSIAVPHSSLAGFRDVINDLINQLGGEGGGQSSA